MNRRMLHFYVAAALAVSPALAAWGQSFQTSACDSHEDSNSFSFNSNHRYSHCEVRTVTLAAGQQVEVYAVNGGISVVGEDRNDIQVAVRIQTWGDTQAEADKRAGETTIQTANNRIRAETPHNWHGGNREAVSFHVLVPRHYSVKLEDVNGGISVAGVDGAMTLNTENGAISMKDCVGDVHGRTQNGSINIAVEGASWQGTGLDAETTNGSATITLPENFSAHLEAGVVNGSIRVDFPITLNHFNGKEVSTDIGKGGAPIRLHTVNGNVSVRRSRA